MSFRLHNLTKEELHAKIVLHGVKSRYYENGPGHADVLLHRKVVFET
jgi:hypothetical protein